MCGIAGIIGRGADKTFLTQLLAPISHRGEEKYRNEISVLPGMAIGAHRLAIVDEYSGKQPKHDNNKKVFCVFNGEIYNHSQLRQELLSDNNFLSQCDSEVVLYSYLRWGNKFIQHFDGKFALAIYNSNNQTLILARDPMGVKPLYYAHYQDNLIFSSELKSFSNIKDNSLEIMELEPGSMLKEGIIIKYYTLSNFVKQQSFNFPADNTSKLKYYLTNAVRKRIPQESSKLACLLSGGIDSSVITYIASKIHPRVVAYTLAAPGIQSADLQSAKELCDKLDIEHIVVSPSISEMQAFYLKHGTYMTESFEPILVRNAVSYYFLCCKVAQDGFKYCLNGEGADELFGGYDFVREVPTVHQDSIIWYSLSIIHKTYLQMADRASMFTTLEARVPYMDKELVKFCLSLPPETRINRDNNKVLLRKLFVEELPLNIVNRRKSGMNEGAGFGINASNNSIYYNAVKEHYQRYPHKYQKDLVICKRNDKYQQIDLTSIEEVYNFGKFVKFNYIRLKDSVRRLQLNSSLRPDTLDKILSSTSSANKQNSYNCDHIIAYNEF
ncbi:MAG: 7-cyano-7-deazaguanine synthase [Rickettsiales bacterium]|nr:7-cyano-7-deazaguanine synthase [Rickettsiales bacterium]